MVVTLDIYAAFVPDAKRAAVDKVADSFDVDLDSLYDFPSPGAAPSTSAGALTFSVDQLKAMLKPISSHTFCRGVFRYLTKDGRALAADYLNLDRSALSKELGKMQKEGILEFHKNKFTLRHPSL